MSLTPLTALSAWRDSSFPPYLALLLACLSACLPAGGGKLAREKHLEKGKMLPRDRVHALLDPGWAHSPRLPFLSFPFLSFWFTCTATCPADRPSWNSPSWQHTRSTRRSCPRRGSSLALAAYLGRQAGTTPLLSSTASPQPRCVSDQTGVCDRGQRCDCEGALHHLQPARM